MKKNTRRQFLKASLISPVLLHSASCQVKRIPATPTKRDINSVVRIAAIGMGIMGFQNVNTSLSLPNINLIAVCDLYSGRLQRAKELYGDKIDTYTDYRKLLQDKSIDAVIVSTSDHWHDHITIAALQAGKHVYCEKPMVHHVEEGLAVIQAEKNSDRILQVGSQRVSASSYTKAKELFAEGQIGQLILVEACFDRQSALGAWKYSIPTDASTDTVNWDLFVGDAAKRPFDATRFFRWRNYQEYGTGVSGDMLVHFFSGFHRIISSFGPERIYATGGLRYWNDGRDVPDVMLVLADYPKTDNHPAFNAQLRVNFIDGFGGHSFIRLIGSEGVMEVDGSSIAISKNKVADAPGYGGWDSYNTFSQQQQIEFENAYNKQYNPQDLDEIEQGMEDTILYKVEDIGYSTDQLHHLNFYTAIREGTKVIEDGTFGLRAAAPALLANTSYLEKQPIFWDPIHMKRL